MDPNTPLDYALFQLTPTRTRCDLVVFSEGEKEKLASGLVDPFLAHLRYAKEQIPKGGYSITLRPPPSGSSWFTKGTLERFVRFVSTPEVLERFVTIEREITQIELSIQSNELSNNEAAGKIQQDADNNGSKSIVQYKPKAEGNGIEGAIQEENSKIRLQRVLETRKAVLRKEQAMAYYRAFVAGFEMECIDDLIAFADAFGASRLSDACMNFKELCYKKHNDGLWMDELAAMETYAQPELPYLGTSGITLTTENNNLDQSILQNFQNGGPHGQLEPNGSGDASGPVSAVGSDVNQGQMPPTTPPSQFPMSWPNQLPQFMYNFPNQQMPPYQGYPFPGMHPSHYQGNMHWPPQREVYRDSKRESSQHRDRKISSKKKEKSLTGKASHSSEQDEHAESSDSTSEDELDANMEHDQKHSSTEQIHKRKNGKKSSRMVVIRNINYITSKRKDEEKNDESEGSSMDDDEFIDGDALKQRVRDAVGSLEKHKTNSGHHKKKGGTKNVNKAGRLIDVVNHDLESDSFANTSEGVQTNENWGAFQNLLLKADDLSPNETETEHTLDVRDEYFMIQGSESGPHFATGNPTEVESELGTKHRMPTSDSFVITGRQISNDHSTRLESFVEDENLHVTMKKQDYTDEELLYAHRNNDVTRNIQDSFSEGITETFLTKTHRGEDWFIINQPEDTVGTNSSKDSSIFGVNNASKLGGDEFHAEKKILVDDSFMIQDRSVDDDQSGSQWRTDISMVSGLTVESHHNSGLQDPSGDKCGKSASYEPDDLYMVLDRNSGVEPDASRDYGMDMSLTESRKQHFIVNVDVSDEPANVTITDTKANGESEKKKTGKDALSKSTRGSLGKSKNEIMSRNKKPYTASRVTMQKTKYETEEETRKRMEELLIERQKRIAERSASKKSPGEIKKATNSIKDDKRTTQAGSQDTKKFSMHKPGATNSTVNRLTASTGPSKSTQLKKTITKVPGELAPASSPKTARDENTKLKLNPAKSSKQSNGLPSPLSEVKGKDQVNSVESKLKVQVLVPRGQPSDDTDTLEDRELLGLSTHAKMDQKGISDVDTLGDKSCNEGQMGRRELSSPVEEHPLKLESSPIENGKLCMHDEKIDSQGLQGNKVNTETAAETPCEEPKEISDSTDFNFITTYERNPASEILEEVSTPDWIKSTPPSTIEIGLDQSHSRKKWSSEESAPTSAKGLKKLLMFGRKKSQVAA